MKIDEIYKQKWKISPKLQIQHTKASTFEVQEQECHINIVRSGFENPNEPEALIESSYPKWITKLSKCKSFVLNSVLISDFDSRKNEVLSVSGKIDIHRITLNKGDFYVKTIKSTQVSKGDERT
jgi:hypothetical protein